MADFSSFTSKFRAQKNGSHKSPAGRPRLVCNQCQKSKLRCDRGQPCGNCIRKDEAAACNYQQRSTGSGSGSRNNAVAEDRLSHLESMVKQLMQNQNQAESQFGKDGTLKVTRFVLPPDGLRHVFSGHAEAVDIEVEGPRSEQVDGNTRYVGSTHWSDILDDIQELKVAKAISSSVDVKGEEPIDPPPPSNELIFGFSHNYSLQEIITQYLPSKTDVDRYLSTYFQGETYIVPFIHIYHFQHQYREFWSDVENVNPLWLSILFSICYISSLIRTGAIGSSQNNSSDLHTAAAQCLVLGQYHLPQPFTLEALALYAQCKNLQGLDPSREVGAILCMVVRMAFEMGYHRDADSFGSFTVFEGEMRRRFWAACKQLDLMISFQLGLPSNICLEHCDTKSPRNLLDSDFDAGTEILPPSRSENEPTRLLWFIVKDRQLISFSKVCQNALSLREKSKAEVLQLDKEIREMYTTIPAILRTRPLSESIADAPFLIMTRLYIDFIHLKSLCVLHRKYIAQGNYLSTRSCVDAGQRLVRQFIDMYKEFETGGQLYAERWMLNSFTMNDFLLGVMVLCLVIHIYHRKRDPQNQDLAIIDQVTENEILALLEQAHTICVEKSGACRGAKRVSHAVHLTLHGVQGPNNTVGTSPHIGSSDAQPTTAGEAFLPPWHGYIQGDETAFGLLDPFSFMGNEMDWTVFETI